MLRPLLLSLAAALIPLAGCGSKAAKVPDPAPAAELLGAVDIPYEQFELENGLRVLVHTDRKAPIVAVSVWYDVGSKHEPLGKTGFAHLFEHLMFNGTENVPGDYFEPLRQVGATDLNGTTWFDRTNYFQTVPVTALEVALGGGQAAAVVAAQVHQHHPQVATGVVGGGDAGEEPDERVLGQLLGAVAVTARLPPPGSRLAHFPRWHSSAARPTRRGLTPR